MSLDPTQLKWMGIAPDGESILIRKFHGDFPAPSAADVQRMQNHPEDLGLGVVIDVETTGLNRHQDCIIELGIRKFRFQKSNGHFLEIGESFNGFQNPGVPLSREIIKLTGITDEFLKGKSIDWQHVEQWMGTPDVVIAHNASFDRPFVDRMLPTSQNLIWSCSLKQLGWKSKGFPSSKLEVLCLYHGFFTDAHRALNDSDALLYLLSLEDVHTKAPYLSELLTNAKRPFTRISAFHSPYESKDLLRVHGYQWDSHHRVWHKTLYQDESKQEIQWLEQNVYQGPFRGKILDISVTDHFK